MTQPPPAPETAPETIPGTAPQIPPETATRTDGALPLGQYAALGDGRSVALLGADGSVDWWCVPNMDSEPLFDRLLDAPAGGRFSLTPDAPFTVERRYRPDSNVLEQTFATATGRARVTSSLNSGISGRLPWSELAQRVDGLDGTLAFDIVVRPGRRLDRATPWREPSPHGDVLHVDGLVVAFRADDSVLRTVEDDCGIEARLVTAPGSRATLALLASADEPLILPPLAAIDARIDRSDQAWREWTSNLDISPRPDTSSPDTSSPDAPRPDAPLRAAPLYGDHVRRSALALKLLLFSPTGAIAAAATTSLPERVGGDKNYDYRYAWVRDIAYTIAAFLDVGATEEARAGFSWLAATVRRHGPRLRTMYRLDGALAPEEETLDLPGYRDSRPVRRGNRARTQDQLGVFGDLMVTAAMFVDRGHVLDLATRNLLAEVADRCADVWHGRDSGIWELEESEHYTMTKIGCWTALDRAHRLAELGQIDTSHAGRWARERDRIRDWVDAHCWSEAKQAYTLHPGTDRLDASLLLAVRFGFERRDRLALTRDAIARELSRGPLVHRYSGMEDEEGTFTACGFWMAEAYALLGEPDAARRQMDGMLERCTGRLGLMTEQVDADTGAMLGNVPQALSHLALIQAAASINAMG